MKSISTLWVNIWLILCCSLPAYASIGSQGMRQQVTSLTDICTTQFAIIENELTISGFDIVNIQLSSIEGTLNACCSALESQLDEIIAHNTAIGSITQTVGSTIDELGNKLDTCCSHIDSQLDVVESKVDEVDYDLQVLSASNMDQIVKNLSAIDTVASQVDQSLSKISDLSSSIYDDLSELDIIVAGVSRQTSALDSKLAICCTQLDSQLDRIESKIDTNDSAIMSQVSALNSTLSICATQLDSQLDRIESKIDTNDGAITSQINAIGSKLDVCCTQLDSQLDRIESKIDTNDSAIASQLSAISSKVSTCATQLDSQLDRIESTIDNISVTASADLSPVISKLALCCTQIDSQLDRIESKIDTANTSIISELSRIDTKLSSCATQLDSQLDRIESKIDRANEATPITTSTTLSIAGAYCLANNISGDVAITGSNITFDLSGRTISGGTYGINISGDQVTVANGTIQNATTANIYLTGNKCLIEGCDLIGSAYGLSMFNGTQNRLSSCCAISNTMAGFSLLSSATNNITNCTALANSGSNVTYGFITQNGTNNLFEGCKAEGTTSTSASSLATVAGFMLFNELASRIISSEAFGTQATNSAHSYGMAVTIASSAANYGSSTSNAARSVAWAPNGNYLAVGGDVLATGNELQIYGLNNGILYLITSVNLDETVYAVSWSPNNQYLAVATNGGHALKIYAFNGSTLTFKKDYDLGRPMISVEWAPDGVHLVTGAPASVADFIIWYYDAGVTNLYPLIDHGTGYGDITSLSWDSTNSYLVIGAGTHIVSYYFNHTLNTVSTIQDTNLGSQVYSLQRSPNGNYFLAGSTALYVYTIGPTGLFSLNTNTPALGSQVFASWSLNSQYIAAGIYESSVGYGLGIFYFNGSSLALKNSIYYNTGAGAGILSTTWNPNASYIGIGGVNPSSGQGTIEIYAPQPQSVTNILSKNLVSNTHNSNSTGIGYFVNACTNLFMDNIAYNNDTNTVLTSTCSGVNIYSQIDDINNSLSLPQITQAGTIVNDGYYCLANNISGDIVITATNVTLDLNGYTISSTVTGILVSGSNVIIKNGIITGGACGVSLSGATYCTLSSLLCKGNVVGISLSNASYNTITNCIANEERCTASQTYAAGFELLNTCSNNSFVSCIVNGVYSYPGIATSAYGFYTNGTIKGTVIDSCQIKNIAGLTSGKYISGMKINNLQSCTVSNCAITNICGAASSVGSGMEARDTGGVNNLYNTNMISTVTTTGGSTYGMSINKDVNSVFSSNVATKITSGTFFDLPAGTLRTNNFLRG